MGSFSPLTTIKNISITRKLYFAVGIMALLIALELLTLSFAVHTLSAVRAYVEGEGLWSKSQKDAVHYLRKYARYHDESDYTAFKEFMKVPQGDHAARLELMKEHPDFNLAKAGFIQGRNDAGDVDGMITLFRRFHDVSYIHKAIDLWGKADQTLYQLTPISDEIHREIISTTPSPAKMDSLFDKVGTVNDQVTNLEDGFSFTLGEGSRWLEHIVLRLLFAVALTVEITGLVLTISVSRSIQKGLSGILSASKRIAKGDFHARAQVYSQDEIGILANSFNHMAGELEQSTQVLKDYARRLERSNDSLEQFAYVASHDLQEPLRTVTNFGGLLQEKMKDNPDETAQRYINHVLSASERMKLMVRDVLYYSRIGKQRAIEEIDCKGTVEEVLADMNTTIIENKAKIVVGHLPVIMSSRSEIRQLFQNLLSNAIKYRKAETPPVIDIRAESRPTDWLFAVADNGIGIDPAYRDKIFIIFQRLHHRNEYSGTGIGLATCKKIVELNGGAIWFESVPGLGSTFYFTIQKT